MTGIVTPSPAVSSDQDTDMQIEVTLNGTILTSVVGGATVPYFDAGPPPGVPIKFSCNAGDTGSVTQMDVNAVGDSPLSTPLSFTVPVIIPPPTAVPTTPGVPTITFTNP